MDYGLRQSPEVAAQGVEPFGVLPLTGDLLKLVLPLSTAKDTLVAAI